MRRITRDKPYAFGERLTGILREKGMTQAELAEAVETEPSTISKWVNEKAKPNYELLRATAQALEVPSDYLLGLQERRSSR